MKTDFNRFGVFGAGKSIPPKNSWWAAPELQNNRLAFQQRLIEEELRMIGSRFGGRQRIIDKFPTVQKKRS